MATGLLLLLVAGVGHVSAAEWGSLKGRFVYGGDAPAQPKLQLDKDVDVCGKHDLRDESLIVDPRTKGIANVVIWLDEKKSGRAPEIHESYAKGLDEPVVVANAKCRFEPHVQVMRSGQTLKITNEDPLAHASAVFFFKNPPASYTIAPNAGAESRKVEQAELLPVPITCPIHAWMKSFLMVKDHPYVAVTGPDGSFEMPNLPAGTWTFRVWHEVAGYVDDVTIDDERTRWTLGRFDVEITEDEATDVGAATIAAKHFE